MVDMNATIKAKSDQLNADDLIGGSKTVTITDVLETGSIDQPIAIRFEGDNNQPFKPCKSMRRVLIAVWGSVGTEYIGKSMTLYRDPDVKWAGEAVGGVRISHMSDMEKVQNLALQVTRGRKKPYVIQPLQEKVKKAKNDKGSFEIHLSTSTQKFETTEALLAFLDKNIHKFNNLEMIDGFHKRNIKNFENYADEDTSGAMTNVLELLAKKEEELEQTTTEIEM